MVRPPTFINGMKKGAWSTDEDARLMAHVRLHGHRNWRLVPIHAGLARCGKSCRLRWVNYLQPGLRRGGFTADEEDLIIELHEKLGNKWASIAARLRGRTDHEVKNHWHAHLKKRVAQKPRVVSNTSGWQRGDEHRVFVENPAYGNVVLDQTYMDQENAGFILFHDDKAQLNTLDDIYFNSGYSSDQSSGGISSPSSMGSVQSSSSQTDASIVTTDDDLHLWAEVCGTSLDSYANQSSFDNFSMLNDIIEPESFGYSSNGSWIDISPHVELQQTSFGSPATNECYSMGSAAASAATCYHEKDNFFAQNRENIDAIIGIILQQDNTSY